MTSLKFTTPSVRSIPHLAPQAHSMYLRQAASRLSGSFVQNLGLNVSHSSVSLPSFGFTKAKQISTTVFAEQEARHAGTVKWFNNIKGYGFIVPSDGTPDVFVHQSSILADGFRSLAEGENVEFELSSDNNGRPKAVNVTGPDGAQPLPIVQGQPRMQQNYDNSGGGRGGRDRNYGY